ncbi:MAG: hypothetical protein COZ57_07750 [Armatimonadetes bacterium CG_4_8_14_3_um_filter_66_20]|nr:YfhO family protein [Armatimonadota bacterium]PIX47677.1 MAG: hypothetical protein COZ57_07750 [Armatimonadetes bacterium CG_4_8_14_3_um_filter_66_20]
MAEQASIPRYPRWWPDLLGGGALVVAVLAFFGPLTTLRAFLVQGDAKMLNYPLRTYVAARWSAGGLPLWCPNVACGFPLWGESEAGPLYPPNLLFLLLPAPAALNYLVLLHVALAAVGMFAFCRGCGLSRSGSWLGGLVFSLGGFFVSQVMHVNLVCAVAWLPFVLWGLHTSTRQPFGFAAVLVAVPMALQLLAGHAYGVLIAWVGVGMHATALTFRNLCQRRALRPAIRPLAVAAVGVALAASMSAGQLLPSSEFVRHTWRAEGLTYGESVVKSLPPTNLATLVLPRLFGAGEGYWGLSQSGYKDLWLYCGILPLGLAAMGLAGPRRRLARYAVCFGAVALLIAAGQFTPVWGMLRTLPLFDVVRVPARFLVLFVLALSLLAATGVDALQRGCDRVRSARVRRVLAYTGAASYGLLVVLHCVVRFRRAQVLAWGDWLVGRFVFGKADHRLTAEYYSTKVRWAYDGMLHATNPVSADTLWAVCLAILSLVLLGWWIVRALPQRQLVAAAAALVAGDLWVSSTGVNRFGPACNLFVAPAAAAFLERTTGATPTCERVESVDTTALAYNESMLTALQHVNGLWCTTPLRRHQELMAAMGDRELADARPARTPIAGRLNLNLARALGVRNYVAKSPGALPSGRVTDIRDDHLFVSDAGEPVPRAFVARTWNAAASDRAALGVLAAPRFDPVRESVVTGVSPGGDSVRAPCAGTARIRRYRPEFIDVETDLASTGLVCLMDMDYPGWQAFVDGRRAPVLLANYAFRGVLVEPGRTNLRFVFLPWTLRLGMFLSFLGLAGVTATAVAASVCRRRAAGVERTSSAQERR